MASAFRVAFCTGFALRPVEKPVRTYRLGHVNRERERTQTRHFCLLCCCTAGQNGTPFRLGFGLCTPIRCALISPVPTPYGISCPDRNCPLLGGASPCHDGLGGGTPPRA